MSYNTDDMTHLIHHRSILAVVLTFLIFSSTTEPFADDELPILGEQAVLNIAQETRIGQKIYDQLVTRGLVETDAMLNRYINDLGIQLLSTLDNRVREYRFFIVRDSNINAFALPGGYIGINVGLILSSRNRHQLAAVLAHEIAHVRLRHGLRLMEKSNSTSSKVLLTILAGLLIGSNSDLGAALVYGGAASGQQSMVNYTRDFEYEADRLGIDILQSAGFDGQSMADFFQMLGSASGHSESQNIEYLRTHPVSDNRIAEIESRLQQPQTKSFGPDYFPLFQDYLRYIADDGTLSDNSRFSQALSKIKAGQAQAANDLLAALYTSDRDNFWYGYVYAENLQFLHKRVEAITVYRQLLAIYPDDFIFLFKLMRLLKDDAQFNPALVIGRQLENSHPDHKMVFFELVDLYRLTGQLLLETLAQADYHRLDGSVDVAIKLYDRALNLPDIDTATVFKVQERLAELRG